MARIISLTRKKIINELLHNLAVDKDESFIANGVVVHNCKSYILPILVGNLGDRKIDKLKPSTKSLDDEVQFSENLENAHIQ